MSETNLCTNQGSQACAHWQGAGLFPAVLRTFLFAKGFVLIVLPRHWRTGPPSLCRLLYQHQVCSAAPNFTKGQMETTHGQPLGAALGQRKAFLCTTGPGEGGREGWRKSFWFPLFQKEERRGRSWGTDIPCRWRACKQPGAGSLGVPSCCLRCCCRCPRSISASPSSPPALCEPERRSPQNYHLEKRRQCRRWAARTTRPAPDQPRGQRGPERGKVEGRGQGAGGSRSARGIHRRSKLLAGRSHPYLPDFLWVYKRQLGRSRGKCVGEIIKEDR